MSVADLYKHSRGHGGGKRSDDNLFTTYHGKITMGNLAVSQWCSGHTYFVQKMHLKQKVRRDTRHATRMTRAMGDGISKMTASPSSSRLARFRISHDMSGESTLRNGA
eukprot:370126-Pyramimonas_sp.AAC.3